MADRCRCRSRSLSATSFPVPTWHPFQLGSGTAIRPRDTDVQAAHDALVADGHTIVPAPIDSPFARTFTFADPDGHQVTLRDHA